MTMMTVTAAGEAAEYAVTVTESESLYGHVAVPGELLTGPVTISDTVGGHVVLTGTIGLYSDGHLTISSPVEAEGPVPSA